MIVLSGLFFLWGKAYEKNNMYDIDNIYFADVSVWLFCAGFQH